jgi:hypothetical protein
VKKVTFLQFVLAIVVVIFIRYLFLVTASPNYIESKIWSFQSIDVMKYSRDLAREKLNNPSFDKTIVQQISAIASTGATHVAIGVPYDEEFLPIMRRWVNAARANNLKVWFRGNLSGWEEWFEYKKIDRQTHTKMISEYIVKNSDLFEDGDLFSSCPECENGGPGDPRHVGGVEEYRDFLVTETDAVRESFRKVGKNIPSNLHSMNGDVAKLVMDKETTQKLGGLVVIDHYVATPEKLVADIQSLAKSSGGKIVLGEFGAPIPDIHGNLSESEQAKWVGKAMELLVKEQSCIALNYWTSFGGSTKLWNDDGSERQVANVIRGYFTPSQYRSQVVTWFNIPVPLATITDGDRITITSSKDGYFSLPLVVNRTLEVKRSGFKDYRFPITSELKVRLEPNSIFSFLRLFVFGV